jgi:hypothetical protein
MNSYGQKYDFLALLVVKPFLSLNCHVRISDAPSKKKTTEKNRIRLPRFLPCLLTSQRELYEIRVNRALQITLFTLDPMLCTEHRVAPDKNFFAPRTAPAPGFQILRTRTGTRTGAVHWSTGAGAAPVLFTTLLPTTHFRAKKFS